MSKIKEIILIFGIPFTLSILCLCFGLYILPENCSLFVSNTPGGLSCDGITFSKDFKVVSDDCFQRYCQDLSSETAATLIVSFGILLFFLPPILRIYTEFQYKEIEKIKLTD